MQSVLHTIFKSKELEYDSKKPFWQYKFTREHFDALKEELRKRFLDSNNYDTGKIENPEDAALFVAEYWRQEYSGKKTINKELISRYLFENRWNEHLNEALFNNAYLGGDNLGIQWARINNTLKFRTLLRQGGIPQKILEGSGQKIYTDFILKIIRSNIKNVDELKDRPDLFCYLPKSFQHDNFYSACIDFVSSVEQLEDEFIDNNNPLKSIIQLVKKENKERIRRKEKNRVDLLWKLKRIEQGYKLFLEILLPEHLLIREDDLTDKFLNIYYNDSLIARYIRKNSRELFLEQLQKKDYPVNFDNANSFVMIGESKFTGYSVKNKFAPRFDSPSLWEQNNDNELQYTEGYSTSANQAVIVYPATYNCETQADSASIEVEGITAPLYRVEFNDEIDFYNSNDEQSPLKFKCQFENSYYINFNEASIEGVEDYGQTHIIRKNFNCFLMNDEGNVKNTEYNLRLTHNKKEIANKTMPLGFTQYDIEVNNLLVLKGETFNIGDLNIVVDESTNSYGIIRFVNNDGFQISVIENANHSVKIKQLDNTFQITNINPDQKIPKSIKLKIKALTQNKELTIGLTPPLSGYAFVDKESNIYPNDAAILIDNTAGSRIIIPKNNYDAIIAKLYNVYNNNLSIKIPLGQGKNDLNAIRQKTNALLNLTNVMIGNSKVKLEVKGEYHNDFREELIQGFDHSLIRYNAEAKVTDQDEEITPQETISEKLNLKAIPLISETDIYYELQDINSESLVFDETDKSYKLPDQQQNQDYNKYLIYSSLGQNNVLIKPTLYIKENELQKKIYVRNSAHFVDNYDEEQKKQRENRIIYFQKRLRMSDVFDFDGIWELTYIYFQESIRQKIPYQAFDHLTALEGKPKLIALFVIRLICDGRFDNQKLKEFGEFMGFDYLWIPLDYWKEIISELQAEKHPLLRSVEELKSKLFILFGEVPEITKSAILGYIFDDKGLNFYSGNNNEFLNRNLRRLQMNIGNNLDNLPGCYPLVNREHRDLFPVNGIQEGRLWPIILSPFAASLSSTKKDQGFWYQKNRQRPTILYTKLNYPKWYYNAFHFFLTGEII
jgi:hypothetical protein